MKNFIFSFIFAFIATFACAQEKSAPKVTFQGGLWAGTNRTTTFIGFVGPKLSVTTALTQKCKIEIGITGIPGLMIRPEVKLGLCAGGTLTFKFASMKCKPFFGCMLVKQQVEQAIGPRWQPMFGVGVLL